jgi:hypothetical protein
MLMLKRIRCSSLRPVSDSEETKQTRRPIAVPSENVRSEFLIDFKGSALARSRNPLARGNS